MASAAKQASERPGTARSVDAVGQPLGMSVLCCVAGTLIRTPQGEVMAEDLHPGDLILTLDNGPQPLCRVTQHRHAAPAELAPICIRAGTLGPHATVFVSPDARIMIRDSLAALLFGDAEVLVSARDLINGGSVTGMAGGLVDYVRLGFAAPQLIYAHGLVTASLLPVEVKPTRVVTGLRRILQPFEAQVLMTAAA